MKISMSCVRTRLMLPGILLLFCSCCPSGVWQDNFGVTYQLLTYSLNGQIDNIPITGIADTGELGCGLWTVAGTSQATTADRTVELLIINPKPNPDDQCCYSFQFNGHLQGSGCLFIPGQYETNDGKCTRSGEMYLRSLR